MMGFVVRCCATLPMTESGPTGDTMRIASTLVFNREDA